MYQYSPFMIVSIMGGESKPIYRGLCTTRVYGEGYFSQHGWHHSVCIGSAAYAFLQLLTMICNFSFYSLDTRLDYGCVHLTYAKARCELKILK
jgi:hypothetical protein